MQAKKRYLLKQISAVVILAIFSLAITPWSALHHHEENIPIHEKNCTKHSVHVKTSTENCLICKAHFEKNFVSDFYNYVAYLKANLVESVSPLVGNSFTKIIASCLRGPPENE